MLDMALKAVQKVRGLTRSDFDSDENLRLALTRLIQVIGEAARQVSPAYTAAHPEVPWRDIVGMRHKIVHDYLAVDEDVVWQVVSSDLPQLARHLGHLVEEGDGRSPA